MAQYQTYVYESDHEPYNASDNEGTTLVASGDASYDINDAEINDFIKRLGNEIPIASARDEEIINQLLSYINTLQVDKDSLMKENENIKIDKIQIEEEYWTMKQENYRLVSENQLRKSVLKEQKQDFMHAIRHSFSQPNRILLPHSDSYNHHSNPNPTGIATGSGGGVDASTKQMHTLSPNSSALNLFGNEEAMTPLKKIFDESELKALKNDLEDKNLTALQELEDNAEQELEILDSQINKAKQKLKLYETKIAKIEELENENQQLNEKLTDTTEQFSIKLIEKEREMEEQTLLIQEQLQMMQHMEEDIQTLEGHINSLNDQINLENQDISYLQEQLKTREEEIQSAKQKRDQATESMIFKYTTTMKTVESPKARAQSSVGSNSNPQSLADFENYTQWGAMSARSFKDVDTDDWGIGRTSRMSNGAALKGVALPEDGEIDFKSDMDQLNEKIANLEQEVSELRVSKLEIMKQTKLEREEYEQQSIEYRKLEEENIELQDKCESLNDRIVQMKVEYRQATRDEHDETAALLRKDRGAVKFEKKTNKKQANACVMFGFGIW